MIDSIVKDIRWAIRTLAKSPAFTLVAVLSLAFGIGANTAIFQLVDAVRLRTLPVKNPAELADIRVVNMRTFTGSMRNGGALTAALWEGIQSHAQSFSSLAASGLGELNLAKGGEVRNAHAMLVSGGFFRSLGVKPMIGSLIGPENDAPGCTRAVAVISHGFWQSEYAGDPGVLGRQLTLEGEPFSIAGVTPAGFYGVEIGANFDVAVPICAEPRIYRESSLLSRRSGWWLSVIGRLRPGFSLEKASAELDAMSPGLMESTVPEFQGRARNEYLNYRLGARRIVPGRRLRARFETPLEILLAMTGMVLLIACANLANLMLARATGREQEVAVRMAVGASRWRVLRQMLTESLMISLGGTLVGLLLAQWISSLLVATTNTRRLQVFLDLQTDWRVLGFSALLAIATSIAFGLAPAIRATGGDPGDAIKSGGRAITAARGRFGLQRLFVISQVALSMALLAGALLFVRSFRNLVNADTGFHAEGVMTANVDFAKAQIPAERRNELRNELLERIRVVRGVSNVGIAWHSPLSGSTDNVGIEIDHQQKGDSFLNGAGPGFFATLDTQLLAGRDFDSRDTANSTRVAIVNASFAHKFFNNNSPVGRTFGLGRAEPKEPETIYQIVGMVRDAKLSAIREEPVAIAYVAAAQEASIRSAVAVVVRTSGPVAPVIDGIKHAVGEVNPTIDLEFRLLSNDIRDLMVSERLMAQLAGFFGVLALLLAVIGLYGVMSYVVARRRHEIGIRLALGADGAMIVRMVLREALLLAGAGLAIGTAVGLAAVRLGASLLYGLQPRDPVTFVWAGVSLVVAALIAVYLPARRAAALDPLSSLRAE